MKTILKQAILLALCLVGIWTSVVHTQGQTGTYIAYGEVSDLPSLEKNETEPDVSKIDQEVKHINHLELQKIGLNIEVCECWQHENDGYSCDFEGGGYEYSMTFHINAEKRIRKVNYSKFSLRGDYVLDLEEYYDMGGELIYLEYGGIGNKGGSREEAEIHGEIYFQESKPVKNLSYEVDIRENGVVFTSNQLEPDEFHVNLESLHHTLQAHIELFMEQLIDVMNEPHEDMKPVLPAVQQRFLKTVEFYKKLQIVLPSGSSSSHS
jgi:hypothetical protein